MTDPSINQLHDQIDSPASLTRPGGMREAIDKSKIHAYLF